MPSMRGQIMCVADNYIRFTLLNPKELREQLQIIAKENRRSLNSEIILMLQSECEKFKENKVE